MKRYLQWILLILTVLSFSTAAFGSDDFVLNLQDGLMQANTDNSNTFAKFVQLNVDSVVNIPGDKQSLLFYLPFKENERGKIFLTGEDGHVVNTYELGYARFVKAVSSDQRHLLVSYKTDKGTSSYELAYFQAGKGELIKTPLKELTNVYDIKFSPSGNTAYVLGLDNGKRHVLLCFSVEPFSLKNKIDLGSLPVPDDELINVKDLSELFMLSNEKAVVINKGGINSADPSKTLPGQLVLVNIAQSSLTDQVTLPSEVYCQWFPKSKTLIVAGRDLSGNVGKMNWQGNGVFIRVNEAGVRSLATSNWWNYKYEEDTDIIYYLTNDQFGKYKFGDNTPQQWDVGLNEYTFILNNWVPSYPDGLRIIQNGNAAICWNPKSGRVRLIDLVKKTVTMKLTGFSLKGKALDNNDGKTVIGCNSDYSRFYLLKTENKVQVLNNKFEVSSTIMLPDFVVGMYQTDSSTTLIITKRNIYRIAEDKLVSIYEFKGKINESYLMKNGGETLILTDRELLRLDSTASNVTSIAEVQAPLDNKVVIIDGYLKEKLMHLPH